MPPMGNMPPSGQGATNAPPSNIGGTAPDDPTISKLQQDLRRPVIYHLRAATCWRPEVKGLTTMAADRWRFEEGGT